MNADKRLKFYSCKFLVNEKLLNNRHKYCFSMERNNLIAMAYRSISQTSQTMNIFLHSSTLWKNLKWAENFCCISPKLRESSIRNWCHKPICVYAAGAEESGGVDSKELQDTQKLDIICLICNKKIIRTRT